MYEKLPVVARLYYTGLGSRRYKRASTRNGPGEPLSFTSVAEEALHRERAKALRLANASAKLLCDPGNPDYQENVREALAGLTAGNNTEALESAAASTVGHNT
jgi:hypothetical protein